MIDLGIVLIFVAFAVFNGFRSRKKASANLNEYFLAGRSLTGWRAGLSMAATQFSADTPLLIAGLVAAGGIFLIWQIWVFAIAFLMLGFLFGGPWRRAKVITDAELCEMRYGGRLALWLRIFKAFYYGTFLNCTALAFVLVATVRITEVFLIWHQWLPEGVYDVATAIALTVFPTIESVSSEISSAVATTNAFISISLIVVFTLLYSTVGGLRSVVATDVVQFIIAAVSIIIFTLVLVMELGGLGGMLSRLTELYGSDLSERFLSFSPMHESVGAAFLVIIAINWFFQSSSDGTGYLAQRAMACKSDRDVKIAILVFSWAHIILRGIVWAVMAVGLLVLFPAAPEDFINISDAVRSSREASFAEGIKILLPVGLMGLMLTGLLAALSSTLDTHLNWGSSYWSNDVYDRLISRELFKRQAGDKELVWVARISNVIIIGIAIFIMGKLGSIAQGWKVFLLLGAGTGSVMVLRWVWERTNAYSELSAIAVSLIGSLALLHFLPDQDQEWLRLSIMGAGSTLVVIIVSLVTPQTDPKILEKFYTQVDPPGFWKTTSLRLGSDNREPVKDLFDGLFMIVVNSFALFLALLGFGKLLLPIGEPGVVTPMLMIGGSALLLWFSISRINAQDPKLAG